MYERVDVGSSIYLGVYDQIAYTLLKVTRAFILSPALHYLLTSGLNIYLLNQFHYSASLLNHS